MAQQHITIASGFCGHLKAATWLCRRYCCERPRGRPLPGGPPACNRPPLEQSACSWSAALTTCTQGWRHAARNGQGYALDTSRTNPRLTWQISTDCSNRLLKGLSQHGLPGCFVCGTLRQQRTAADLCGPTDAQCKSGTQRVAAGYDTG